MRPTLFDSPYVVSLDCKARIKDAITFLINNQYTIVSNEQLSGIENQRLFSSTPVSKIFKSIAASGKLNNFMFTNYSTLQNTAIPEVLTTDFLCIDGAAIPQFQVPAVARKCWINITPIVGKSDAYNNQIFFNDQSMLAQLVTRAALCTAYADKDMWLTINQMLCVIELYATVIAQTITNIYNLNPDERRLVMTLFAMYYASLVGSESSNESVSPLLMRCPFLGDGSDILKVAEAVEPYRDDKNKLTLNGLVAAIQNVGPTRMKSYSLQMLYRSTSAASVDSSTMIIAMDYPPYWVYQLLRVASGYKNPIISGIVKTLNIKQKLTRFADDVADNPNLLGAINRI